MRIDHYSTYTFGGAGNGARRLHDGLLKEGIESRFFYRESKPDDAGDRSLQAFANDSELPRSPSQPVKWLKYRISKAVIKRNQKKYLKNRPLGYEVFSTPNQFGETPWLNQNDLLANSTRIIHLHWVAFWLDFKSFFQSLPPELPLVWTLHDMNPFTGGCHYSSGCKRFQTGCGNCPQLDNSNSRDLSYQIHRQKFKLFRDRNLTIVTPSKWLCDEAASSGMFPPTTRFESINLGLDTECFRPVAKEQARKELGLPTDVHLVAFGAEDLQNRRKGMPFLWNALDQLHADTPVDALFFGRGKPDKKPAGIRNLYPLGFLSDPHKQRLVYSAADLFVMPSLEDNQPQMGLEAMACGTPVSAFDTGGIPEYVRPGETGDLAVVGDAASLSASISRVLADDCLRLKMGRQARLQIEENFPLQRQARNYLKLYQQILGIDATGTSARQVRAA